MKELYDDSLLVAIRRFLPSGFFPDFASAEGSNGDRRG